ncbi:MAG: PAS domain S-box protein [Methylococcaceae bacterium]|nr:MAG: PAS domain S-box protein [Methylococcaceae bacterium]
MAAAAISIACVENLPMPEHRIKLGLMPPLTGLVDIYGAEISRAGQIACAEINASGGVLGRELELVIEDDGSLPESAVAAAIRLVEQHRCVAIVGNLLSNSRIAVAYRVAEPRKIPYLNFSFYEGSILSRYFFHFAALPNQQIDRMIPSMCQRYGPRMFFAGNNYEWPRGSIDAAKRALEQTGGQTVGEEYCPIGVSGDDIERLLDHVAASGAEVFVPYFAGTDQVHLLTRFTERGMKQRMAVVMGHYDEIMASRLPAQVRAGFYSSNTYFMTLDTPENRAYLACLAAMPGVSGIWPQGNGILTNFGEGTYLCVKAFAQAANQAGSLAPEALVDALETVCVTGPQGSVQMDPATHHARVNTCLSRCQADGRFAIVERFGAIEPLLPARYRHLRIRKQSELDEDIHLQARMIAQMSEAIFLVDAADSRIIYTNPGAERLFGYDEGALAGRNFAALFAPDGQTAEQQAAAIGETVLEKGVWQGETTNISRDGAVFCCAVSVSVFTHPRHGEVWMVLAKDITERKRAEETLRKSEFLFRSLFELGNIGVAITSPEKGWLRVNPRLCRMLGYEEAELLCMDWAEMTYPEDLAADVAQFERMLAGDVDSYEMDKRFFRKDGGVIYTRLTVACYRNAGKVQFVMAGLLDISESKLTEQELLLHRNHLEELVAIRTAELRRQQAFTTTALENISDGIVACDDRGVLSFFNRTTREIHGIEQDDLPPQRWSEHYRLLQADGVTPMPTERIPLFRAFQGERVRDQELVIAHVDGSKRILLCSGQPMYDKEGAKIGAVVSMHDVTAQKQAEAELIKARDAAEAANRAKSVFLANMSHELRTPLNAILGFVQLMARDAQLNAQHRSELDTINRAGRHLLALINDVLEISRIEAGRTCVQKAVFDLDDCLRAIEDIIRVRAQAKGLAFSVERCGLPPRYVDGDAHHLSQVLINLLGNAVKYTDQGGVVLRLTPTSVFPDTARERGLNDHDLIRFEVIDSGPGIAAEDQPRIFKPFYQTEAGIAKGEGTGLGLTISQEFVRLMGGRIELHSQPGQGCVFAFTLPLPAAEAPAPAPPVRRVAGLAPHQSSRRVLVAEDNADNRELICRLLQSAGFDVLTVENGRQAIDAFQAWRPDVICMDMRMPVLDGYQATRAIRALPGGGAVKIVALTASVFQEDRHHILGAGCDDMLTKPLDFDRLLQRLGELLNLELQYAEPEPEPEGGLATPDLSGVDAATRAELARAAELLDMEAVQAIIERLRPEQPALAQTLAAWVDAYRFDAVAELCRRAVGL